MTFDIQDSIIRKLKPGRISLVLTKEKSENGKAPEDGGPETRASSSVL